MRHDQLRDRDQGGRANAPSIRRGEGRMSTRRRLLTGAAAGAAGLAAGGAAYGVARQRRDIVRRAGERDSVRTAPLHPDHGRRRRRGAVARRGGRAGHAVAGHGRLRARICLEPRLLALPARGASEGRHPRGLLRPALARSVGPVDGETTPRSTSWASTSLAGHRGSRPRRSDRGGRTLDGRDDDHRSGRTTAGAHRRSDRRDRSHLDHRRRSRPEQDPAAHDPGAGSPAG